MALVKCTECKSEISSTALFCPKCGCKKPFKGVKLSKAEAKDMGMYQRAAFRKRGGKAPRTLLEKFGIFSVAAFALLIAAIVVSTDGNGSKTGTKENAQLKRGLKQLETAMKDPRKMRFMECNGIDPWQTKPTGWKPPTKQECAEIDKVLTKEVEERKAKDPAHE